MSSIVWFGNKKIVDFYTSEPVLSSGACQLLRVKHKSYVDKMFIPVTSDNQDLYSCNPTVLISDITLNYTVNT